MTDAAEIITRAICCTEGHETGVAFEQVLFGKDVDAMVAAILRALAEAGLVIAPKDALVVADARIARLEAALTPSAGTKADYIGEFKFNIPWVDENDEETYLPVLVPWDTTKEIMKAILARAAIHQKDAPQ